MQRELGLLFRNKTIEPRLRVQVCIHQIIKVNILSFALNSVSGRRFLTDQRSSWGKSLVASRGNTPGQQWASGQGCEVIRIKSLRFPLILSLISQTTSGRLSSLGGGRCLGGDVQGVLKEHLQPKRDVPPHRGRTCNFTKIRVTIARGVNWTKSCKSQNVAKKKFFSIFEMSWK